MTTTKRKAKSSTPEISRRLISTFIDGVIALAVLVSLLAILDLAGMKTPFTTILMVVIAASYEPLFSVFWCTAGQKFTGVRVRNYNTNKRPSVYEAYLRYFYKVVIGWKSLVFYSEEHSRLIHDNFAGTVVVMRYAA